MRKTQESIFDGESIVIPMADVQHYEKHWYAGDDKTYENMKGFIIVTKHTKWNFEHDTWENAIYLPQPDADRFRLDYNRYRQDIEDENLVDLEPPIDEPYGTCGFCNNDGPITKDPEGLMCDRCWDKP